MPNGGYYVYYPSNIFRNTSSFENWGISLGYSPVFSHVTRLDQWRASENNRWIMILHGIIISFQDALSSIIVARDGFGDMAVSNAIGSNVFDINLGIGLPFVIRTLIDNMEPIRLLTPDEEVKIEISAFVAQSCLILNSITSFPKLK